MEYACGNIFVRTADPMKAGAIVEGHEHNFDHVTYVPIGAFKVERMIVPESVRAEVLKKIGNPYANWSDYVGLNVVVQATEVRAGEVGVLIKAGVVHRLTALEDDSVYHCIYAHRLPQGDVVQRFQGWLGAYS